jgi:hypothetical protein
MLERQSFGFKDFYGIANNITGYNASQRGDSERS